MAFIIELEYPKRAIINTRATQRSTILAGLFRKGKDFASKYKTRKETRTGPQLKPRVKMLRPAIISKMPKINTIM